jgi:hypothetical protein
MALKVKAVEKKIKFDKNPENPGVWRYVMSPELYTALTQAKVVKEAALRSGVSRGVMQACWDAAGEVIKVKRVTSTSGEVEDPENENGENGTTENGNNESTENGGNTCPDQNNIPECHVPGTLHN